MPEFEARVFTEKLDSCIERFKRLVLRQEQDNGSDHIAILEKELKYIRERGYLTLAFIGAYNAGKSTTISAITGRRDIKIDTDIATAKVSEYDWLGIRLIDTPGLNTERLDHDEITYAALSKSDLLVYVLTYSLFDSVTSADFRRLILGRENSEGYQKKIFLIINKINNESTGTSQKERIETYKNNLQKDLEPYTLNDFPICFIDAKDYIDGLEENDVLLQNESLFPDFLDTLNKFIRERGSLGKLDTPARILLDHIDQAESRWISRDGQDEAYVMQLEQLSKRNYKERESLRGQIESICINIFKKIKEEGSNFISQLGDIKSEEEGKRLTTEAENRIKGISSDASNKAEEALEVAVIKREESFQEVLNSSVAESFVLPLIESGNRITTQGKQVIDFDHERLSKQVRNLANIGQKVGVRVSNSAIGRAGVAGKVFLKPGQVAGSQMHNIVLKAGHFFGAKFRPWQAVNIAGKIGNVAKFLGPVLAGIAIVVEIISAAKAEKQMKEEADARLKINAQFTTVASDLENGFRKQLRAAESEIFNPVDKDIQQARREHEATLENLSDSEKELLSIRNEVEDLLQQIEW